ncbi:TPA: type VI secretion system protein TssA [Providencia alcalifaciens]
MVPHDIISLLTPITPENPVGENLEYEPLFDQIRKARESDADYLPQGEWTLSEPRKADWNKVSSLCAQALMTQSKDLQLVCWFIESQYHLKGLAGLLSGIEFLNKFIAQYWSLCWPLLEDDGLIYRRSILQRFDRDLSQYLSQQPVLRDCISTLIYWRSIVAFEQKLRATPQDRDVLMSEEGDLTMATFHQQASQFSATEIHQQIGIVEALLDAVKQLQMGHSTISQTFDEPLLTLSNQTFLELHEYLKRLGQHAVPRIYEETPPHLEQESSRGRGDTSMTAPSSFQTMNRELAISQMRIIADYFRHTEPSSPVPFLMERAARWANMTLTEWLEEMLKDPNSMNDINNVLMGQHAQCTN